MRRHKNSGKASKLLFLHGCMNATEKPARAVVKAADRCALSLGFSTMPSCAFRRMTVGPLQATFALSILTSLFPFLIFVTALAGFFGSKSLADDKAHILLQTWPQQVAAPIANEIHNVLTQTRSGLLTISFILALFFVERRRSSPDRAQSRL